MTPFAKLRHANPLRHPSEGWGLSVGERSDRPMETPAFAGVTIGAGVTDICEGGLA